MAPRSGALHGFPISVVDQRLVVARDEALRCLGIVALIITRRQLDLKACQVSIESEVALSFEGQFNAMMAMMIKAPITNFMGTLSNNMDKIGQ